MVGHAITERKRIPVLLREEVEGVGILHVELTAEGYVNQAKQFRHWMPEVVNFQGTLYGKAGWDSDRGKVFYRTDWVDRYATETVRIGSPLRELVEAA